MGAAQFFCSIKRIIQYRGGHRLRALGRHITWQLRRHRKSFPFEISLTPKSKLIISEPAAVNGCASLGWALGRYDYDNMAFLQDVLEHYATPLVIFDVGANVGVYSLLTSEITKNQVHAFEPHPSTAGLLEQNLKANSRENVTVHRCALTQQTGQINFTNEAGSPVNQIVLSGTQTTTATTISIQGQRGDEFCQQHETLPDVMKIDVEGHEADVIKGFGNLIASVKIILVEENLSSTTLLQLLPQGCFTAGYIDFSKRSFHQRESASKQDVAFINNAFLADLQKLGYTVEIGG
jgi:FkbM family methyltransferase